jgi:F-type H+-transporting ATPase subunit a
MRKNYSIYLLFLIFTLLIGNLAAETEMPNPSEIKNEVNAHEGHDHEGHSHEGHNNTAPEITETVHHAEEHHECGAHHGEFDPGQTAMHHIADANVYTIGPLSLPLPCIVYVKGEGIKMFSSAAFKPGAHGDGKKTANSFVLYGGALHHVVDPSFPKTSEEVCYYGHKTISNEVVKDGVTEVVEKEVATVVLKSGGEFVIAPKSTLDGGLFGGGITSWYDFSLTKNVVSLLLVFAFLTWLFIGIKNAYQKREGMAPSGIQSLIEPIFAFIQDEVSKPILGAKWEKYQPFLMSIFFFILGLNLFGQIPFFGNSNVTGHISVTIALALFTALVVNLSGNKHYWKHILWMPGVPAFVKVILTPVELLGVILKPMTLFIRLFGNLSAGHMVIVIFVSLIFIFGKAGESLPGSITGIALSVPLTMFMLALELLVAFLQAFVFTILSAVYIGSAVEEHHH